MCFLMLAYPYDVIVMKYSSQLTALLIVDEIHAWALQFCIEFRNLAGSFLGPKENFLSVAIFDFLSRVSVIQDGG